MQTRMLGQTDIEVSVLGLGTVKFGRNEGLKYPESFKLPDDKALANLLALARDLGINLLDTAPAYGYSEERLGTLLKGQRQQWVLASKAGETFTSSESQFDFTARGIIASVERSLKRLRTDYLDIVLIHSDGNDEKIIQQDNALQTLADLKRAGKIRAFGMSTKTVAGGQLALDHSDLAMVAYHPGYTDELPVIKYAEQQNKGIFIKKAFASGHLDKLATTNPIQAAIQTILKEPGVTSIIMGTINPVHLQENVGAVSS